MKLFKTTLRYSDIPESFYYLALPAVLTLYILKLSLPFNIHYDSDSAVQVLMAIDFNFHSDWYYWGQSRFGSFIPLLGFFIHKISRLEPAWAVTIANLLTLLGAFWAFSTLLNTRFSKLLLLLALFLPYYAFISINQVGFPYPSQLLFLGLTFVASHKLEYLTLSPETRRRAASYAALMALCSVLSVWISEYSVPFLAVLYLRLGLKQYKAFKTLPLGQGLYILLWPALIIGAGAFAIYELKQAILYPSFSNRLFISQKEIRDLLSRILRFFQTELQFKNLAFYQLPPFLVLLYVLRYGQSIWSKARHFAVLFAVGILPAVLLHWVYMNKMNFRYFAPAYFFCWMALILSADKAPPRSLLLFGILCLQAATLYEQRFDQPSRYQRLKAFAQLGRCGILGDYWASYNISAANTGLIVASPHPGSTMRNSALLDSVLNRDKIFLISQNWFSDFPDSIKIKEILISKVPYTEINIDDYELCQYRRGSGRQTAAFNETQGVKQHLYKVFTLNQMQARFGEKQIDGVDTVWVTRLDSTGHTWFGPNTFLEKGNYTIEYHLSVQPKQGADMLYGAVDISAENGTRIIASKKITSQNARDSLYKIIFHAAEPLEDVEFRIVNTPNARLRIKQVRVLRE
jgi:hypothetical protein